MTAELTAASTRSKRGLPVMSKIVSILAALLLALVTFALLRAGVFYSLYTSLLGNIVETTGLDLWPSRTIALALVVLLWFLPWHLLLIPWIGGVKMQVASLTIFAALAMTAMDLVTRDVYFSRADGRPLKYYIQTLNGYKFSATSGIDPVFGIPYQPVTPQFAYAYMIWKQRGGQIQDPSLPEGQYFNPATGEPLRWYARTPEGRLDFFTLPGFHPKYGIKLEPASAGMVAAYEKQKAEAERQLKQGRSRKYAAKHSRRSGARRRRQRTPGERAVGCSLH